MARQPFKVERRSPFSGKLNSMLIQVDFDDWCEWVRPDRTRPIQDIFPYLSADEREFILTGITPDEWPDDAA